METIYLNHPIKGETIKKRPAVIALGYFDGVHVGHQNVIKKTISIAKKEGVRAAVMTFHPHPKEVLQQSNEKMRYITPLEDKIEKIKQLGVHLLYVVSFTKAFSKLTPAQFVDQYLVELGAIHVVAGFDFTYGALGKGTMDTLPVHARNRFMTTTIAKVEENDEKLSTTKIRQLLAAGDVWNIKTYLGDHYSVKGTVVHGEKRGRTIGFPTANVELKDRYLIPKNGVYAVKVQVKEKWYNGVCNVGYKPTFHSEENVTIEAHLFSFNENIYSEKVEVKWYTYIRDEKKFSSVDELVSQITKDKEQALQFFEKEMKLL